MARTELFVRSQPGGVQTIAGIDRHPGSIYFVSSVTGTNGVGYGVNVDAPAATVAYAMANLVTASVGDVIYVLPGHVETIGAAAAIACSVAGVSIIGLGKGRVRPTFTWATSTAATITVSGANTYFENCVFVGEGIDAVVTMFGVTADDCEFNNCEFSIGKTSFVPLLGITVTGAINRFRMIGCFVHGGAVANCTNFVQFAGGGDGHQFIGNTMIGNFTTTLGCINNITTLCSNIVIRDNVFVNRTASATKVAVFLTGTTGLIMKNTCGIGSGAAPFTADAAHWAGNWSAAAVATNGTLV